MNADWPFDDAQNAASITTSFVLDGSPILRVYLLLNLQVVQVHFLALLQRRLNAASSASATRRAAARGIGAFG